MNGIKLKSQEKLKISKKKVIRNVKELKKSHRSAKPLKIRKIRKKVYKRVTKEL